MLNFIQASVLAPALAALCTLVEHCHRLVGRADLHLLEVCASVCALWTVRICREREANAQSRAYSVHEIQDIFGRTRKAAPCVQTCLVGVLPRLRPAEHIINRLVLEWHLARDPRFDPIDIRARLAVEAHAFVRGFDLQQIAAWRAEMHATDERCARAAHVRAATRTTSTHSARVSRRVRAQEVRDGDLEGMRFFWLQQFDSPRPCLPTLNGQRTPDTHSLLSQSRTHDTQHNCTAQRHGTPNITHLYLFPHLLLRSWGA